MRIVFDGRMDFEKVFSHRGIYCEQQRIKQGFNSHIRRFSAWFPDRKDSLQSNTKDGTTTSQRFDCQPDSGRN